MWCFSRRPNTRPQWGVKWKKSVIPFVTWWHLEISFIQSCCLFNAVWRWTSFSWWGGKNHWTFFFKCHSKFVTETTIKEWLWRLNSKSKHFTWKKRELFKKSLPSEGFLHIKIKPFMFKKYVDFLAQPGISHDGVYNKPVSFDYKNSLIWYT